jgi:gamma-glutamylcysteine synthetase
MSLLSFKNIRGLLLGETMQQHDIITEATQLFKSNYRSDADIRSGTQRYIGLENEYLMVSQNGDIISQDVLHYLWNELTKQGWRLTKDFVTGKATSALKPRPSSSHLRTHNYDVITTDYGYATLEINLAPVERIQDAYSPLCELIEMITSILSRRNAYLLGYGVQPVAHPSRKYIGPKSRYELIFDVRDSENELNPEAQTVDLHCINAACQTQVEVSLTEAIPIVNALNATSGLRIALFANSPVWRNKISGYKAIRELFWDWCWPDRKLQVGIPPKFYSVEHYIDYLLDFRPIVVSRNDTFYRLNDNISFRHFLTSSSEQEGVAFGGNKTRIVGEANDIKTQYAFAWINARLQPIHGTIEDRVSCQQPPDTHFCSQAVTLGLVENYQELVKIADSLSYDQWRDIRLRACTNGLNFSYPNVDVRELIVQLLQTAYVGLVKRGFGEEVYLEPLYERVETGQNSADSICKSFLNEGVSAIVRNSDMRRLLKTR